MATMEKKELTDNQHWYNQLMDRVSNPSYRYQHTGVAMAVGTDFDPSSLLTTKALSEVHIEHSEQSSIVGLLLQFPENPSAEEMDRIFKRITDYTKGIIPITLQPGNSVVRQFVLRTRSWLFFTPLAHTFQIQVDYSIDGLDQSDTISYDQSVQSTIKAITIGAVIGGIAGATLKSLTSETTITEGNFLRAIIISILASTAVAVAFARKNTAQPIVSIEDFWGGILIGFTTGFFGFEQFSDIFPTA